MNLTTLKYNLFGVIVVKDPLLGDLDAVFLYVLGEYVLVHAAGVHDEEPGGDFRFLKAFGVVVVVGEDFAIDWDYLKGGGLHVVQAV